MPDGPPSPVADAGGADAPASGSAGVLTGAGVSPGVGAGPVVRVAGSVPEPAAATHGGTPEDVRAEQAAATAALEAVAADLEARGDRAAAAGNTEAREVLRAQAMMALDPGLADGIAVRIGEGTTAARAVFEAFAVYREMLAGAGEYLAARVTDLDDVRDRAVARLLGLPVPGVPRRDDPFVLVARDLAPADTAVLDPAQVVAFVTEEGGPTSHTAILARTMGVPAVVACPGAADLAEGTPVLVDGAAGTVRIDPAEAEIEAALSTSAVRASLTAASTGPGATKDGHAVPLLANIGGPKDVRAALEAGAEGVGLYRTEFLFLDRATPPSDAEQEAAYRTVLEAFPQGKVVVRALDAGADKPLAFLPPPGQEPNPALGERGLRMLMRHPEVLSAQLGALARAAAGLTVRLEVMAPMVTDVAEARAFAAACAEAGIDHPGIMIEVPAAALRAGDLAPEVEFFSVGTNDLTQYACAADRQIGALARLQDAWQPAVLDLVALTAEAAADTERGCGVCGEAAADPMLACVLVGLGVTSLSMSAPSLPLVRAVLARHTLAECRRAAVAARSARSADEARAAARSELPALADLGL
ncbi:phosphoenolpyruvate--protein phosphotransferase [Thermomonospora echinospora]|uniref:Phosphoenolpyruvate-protein phosphotransferase n=1 Tax=Thermomonospora echinospora TaxID=1992 RepID=A0A1H5W874_9ACTN|nr:phosphoenolpyruvate--protein phosphotransferase [Thermomonospora echinospora]SEF95600.1 phosphoenolpyruvate--protein phosphotransferase [Thermomonospora echinospora]